MEELINGTPLKPEAKDAAAALDRLDKIYGQSTAWQLFMESPAAETVKRYMKRQPPEDWFWGPIYAFTLGFMAGVHKERARRRAKAAGHILQRKGVRS